MRIRLTVKEPRDKIAWWRRSSSEVSDTYEELFPSSYLPLFGQFALWLFLALLFVTLVALLRKSH